VEAAKGLMAMGLGLGQQWPGAGREGRDADWASDSGDGRGAMPIQVCPSTSSHILDME
jgi:hypothetical protein